jgi:protein phosphatase
VDDTKIAALFTDDSEPELVNAWKAARRAGGSDDFSVIILTERD